VGYGAAGAGLMQVLDVADCLGNRVVSPVVAVRKGGIGGDVELVLREDVGIDPPCDSGL
jgi:hypothetical protein